MLDEPDTVEPGSAPPGGEDPVVEDSPAPARATHGLWLKIVLFAAGIVVGVLTVGLLDTTTPDFATSDRGGGPLPGGASPSGGGAGVEARVNAACLAVINDAQDVYAVLGDLGPALDDNDLMALDEIVRRLQPVEPRLAADLQGCRIDSTVGGGQTSSPSGPTPAGPTPVGPTPVVPTPVPPTPVLTPVVPPPVEPTAAPPTAVPPTTSAPSAPPSVPATPPGRAPGTIVLR